MAIRNRDEAVATSMKQTRNEPGTCQMTTRGWFNAPSAGDRDGDGDADANDGWLSEPKSARHPGDRKPPKGVPLYFRNRSRPGFGHRCISRDDKGNARSTDMLNGRYERGITGNATIAQIESAMALEYIGWSDTITGQKIPLPPAKPSKPTPSKPPTGTKPPVTKKSAQFKISTKNVQSLPHQKSIVKELDSVAGTHLIGFQEVDPKDYKVAVFKKFPQAKGIGTAAKPANNTYSCPIVHNRVMFTSLGATSSKIYDGVSGISLTRRLTSETFKHNKTGMPVGMVNLHSVLMKGGQPAKRSAMKAEAKEKTFAAVRKHLAAGRPVVITGDFNDKANWFGTKFDGHRVQRFIHGIDQIVLIDGKSHTWRKDSHSVRPTPGDHDTLRAKVTLTEK